MNVRHELLARTRPDPETGCWLWTGITLPTGGLLKIDGRLEQAARASYYTFREELAPGERVQHDCKNKLCVNPAHLSIKQNALSLARALRDKEMAYLLAHSTDTPAQQAKGLAALRKEHAASSLPKPFKIPAALLKEAAQVRAEAALKAATPPSERNARRRKPSKYSPAQLQTQATYKERMAPLDQEIAALKRQRDDLSTTILTREHERSALWLAMTKELRGQVS